MKATRKNIYLCPTYAILFTLFLAVFMLGYISGSIIERVKVSNISIDDVALVIEEVPMVNYSKSVNHTPQVTHVLPYSKKIPASSVDLYAQYVCDICSEYKFVDDLPLLIMAMMEVESNFDPGLTSSAGCVGLMQVSPYWNKDRAERLGADDLWDPYDNILVAVDLLQDLYFNYANEDIVLAVMMYNMDFSAARSMYNRGQWSPYAVNVFEIFDSMKGGF